MANKISPVDNNVAYAYYSYEFPMDAYPVFDFTKPSPCHFCGIMPTIQVKIYDKKTFKPFQPFVCYMCFHSEETGTKYFPDEYFPDEYFPDEPRDGIGYY